MDAARPDEGAKAKSSRLQVRSKCFGLLSQKPRWGLSMRGWIVAGLALTTLLAAGFFGAHPFLAVNTPVETEVLVVEGWIPEEAVRLAAAEFKSGGYKKVYTVGGPVGGMGDDAADDDTYAYVAAKKLERAGVPRNLVQMAPTRVRDRDRTYASAIALREWFAQNQIKPSALNVATLSVHARRTRLLYQEAFGDELKIGVIAIPNHRYVAKCWWKYSEGVKEVVSESAAYFYARVLFSPEHPGA